MYSCIWYCKCPNVMVWLAKSSTCVKEVTGRKSSEHLMSSEQAFMHYFVFEMIEYSEWAARKHGCRVIRSCTDLHANWTVRTISSSVCVLHVHTYIHTYGQTSMYIRTYLMWSIVCFLFFYQMTSLFYLQYILTTRHHLTHHVLPRVCS